MKDKVQKYGLGGLLKYSPLGMSPLTVLKNRPLTPRTLLDPGGLFTDDNYRKKIKKEAAGTADQKGMRKGGKIKEAKMETKHANFMKKKGAPKKMVDEEMAEAEKYAKGGMAKVQASSPPRRWTPIKAKREREEAYWANKPSNNPAQSKYRKGGSCKVKKYAKGGGVEIRGKTRGKII